MADPATLIALQKLSAELIKRITDRKFASEVAEVLRLVNTLQAEYFELQKTDLQLRADNMDLQKVITALQTRASEIDKQNSQLTDENRQLHETIKALKLQIPVQGNKRSDEEEKILLFLWQNTGWPAGNFIAQRMGLELQKAQYLLVELEKIKYVRFSNDMMGNTKWTLVQAGREYLIKNKLV